MNSQWAPAGMQWLVDAELRASLALIARLAKHYSTDGGGLRCVRLRRPVVALRGNHAMVAGAGAAGRKGAERQAF
jgi:hypothetical protein